MARGTLQNFFLPRVVPWNAFVRPPNAGHEAIADMILCKAIAATVTTNFDWLVETTARDKNVALDTALDGDEALKTDKNSPYLKVHGCSVREPLQTVWAPSQLTADPEVRKRIDKSRTWLRSNLRNKDYVFVGFWSDWDYLNAVLEEVISDFSPSSVILVNLETEATLAAKANHLWNLMHARNVSFIYLQCSATDFLDDLRIAYSAVYVRKTLEAGRVVYERAGGNITKDIPIAKSSDKLVLCAVRCDAEGIPRVAAPTKKWPDATDMFAVTHYLLNESGAAAVNADYEFNKKSIRVINGAGREIGALKATFASVPAAIDSTDVVICAGADELAVPAHLIRPGHSGALVRPAASGLWLTFEKAKGYLHI